MHDLRQHKGKRCLISKLTTTKNIDRFKFSGLFSPLLLHGAKFSWLCEIQAEKIMILETCSPFLPTLWPCLDFLAHFPAQSFQKSNCDGPKKYNFRISGTLVSKVYLKVQGIQTVPKGPSYPMRSLEKNCMGRGHQTHTLTDTKTCWLLDQLGPEGRVGEKEHLLLVTIVQKRWNWKSLFYYTLDFLQIKSQREGTCHTHFDSISCP